MNKNTFLWYDLETFGADPRRDRPAQFAARRTSLDLEVLGEAENFHCRPAMDVLPQPVACLITGITPQDALEQGLPENEFSRRIFELMMQPATCTVGFNNFRFDDELVRHLFWRNFHDPYRREWANGNSRFDLIDLMRLARALRPEGLNWPDHEDGRPSFRLEDLAAANGLDTRSAHDALTDVDNTIALARKLKQAQPRLWDWALGLRDRSTVESLLEAHQPLLHASSRFPALPGCALAPVLPLGRHPQYATQWLVWNLNESPEEFLALQPDELADRMWTPRGDLPEGLSRLPLKLVRSNRCPMLAPMNVLDPARAEALGMDLAAVQQHAQAMNRHSAFIDRLRELFVQSREHAGEIDPELDLYGGFPPRDDQAMITRIPGLRPDDLAALGHPFRDERLNELLFRYRARLWPESLDAEEQERWQAYRLQRLLHDPELASIQLPEYLEQLERLMLERPEKEPILRALAQWPEILDIR